MCGTDQKTGTAQRRGHAFAHGAEAHQADVLTHDMRLKGWK
jgi:hypothetical protein